MPDVEMIDVYDHNRQRTGLVIPREGLVRVQFDDSIIQDTAAEKAQDMAEMGVTMAAWEYRMKWCGEDEGTAKARARGLEKAGSIDANSPKN